PGITNRTARRSAEMNLHGAVTQGRMAPALSIDLHPRDRRACLPVSTPYSIKPTHISCRRRIRTSTEQLGKDAWRLLCPLISTPGTGGHVCLFQHPTV